MINLLTSLMRNSREYKRLTEALTDSAQSATPLPLLVTGLCEGALDVFCGCVSSDIRQSYGLPPLILVTDDKEAALLKGKLSGFGINASLFPARDLNLHGAVASREFEHERVRVLVSVMNESSAKKSENAARIDAVIATPEAALSFTIPREKLTKSMLTVSYADTLNIDGFTLALVNAGYTGTENGETVDGAGQFSVRGGIIDVCPPFMVIDGAVSEPETGEASDMRLPKGVRIELFGDEIDRLGTFDVGTQRMDAFQDPIDTISIPPACEVILSDDARKSVAASLKRLIKKAEKSSLPTSESAYALPKKKPANKKKKSADEDNEDPGDDFDNLSFFDENAQIKDVLSRLREELEMTESGMDLPFADRFFPVIYPERESLFDYMGGFSSREHIAIVASANSISQRIDGIKWQNEKTAENLITEGISESAYSYLARHESDLERFLSTRAYLLIETFTGSRTGLKLAGMFDFRTRHVVGYAGNVQLLTEDLDGYIKGGHKVVLLTDAEPAARTIADSLNADGLNAFVFSDTVNDISEIAPSSVAVTWGTLTPFEMMAERFALLSMRSSEKSSGRMISKSAAGRRNKKGKASAAESILSYSDLKEGDFIVHSAYGVGLFTGIENLPVDGVYRDYISLKYAGRDKLFLPVDQLEHVSKYIGAGSADGSVKLSKMGGTDWHKAKAKAKSSARNMAKELIALYAKRRTVKGIAFDPDDEMTSEFAQNFPYAETDDQLDSIEDVTRDMERTFPMDRLLCGDVGYGKTEVALRAAFKAVMSGKQVAILVPTTILALQHTQTALARFAGFPVKIDMLSRFRTPKQQERTLRALKRGEVDIVIGTHRLISEDVQFFDLGLIIVDEEQRFGVAHKEKLKAKWNDIDVLTLTATPIPRTLNMAMSGIRDMSVLTEAPVDRQPVQTYVLEHDDAVITEAIQRELRRDGQVFYMHNRVESIYNIAARIKRNVPDAKIEIAHGKMDREQLEDIWRSLVEGECDILVSTTIIETGIDVPRANTLIIDNADRLGLAQLHQLRGRVGRSERRAYAYFTFPRGKSLTEIAEKRLEAVREYAKFGAGFKIALRDLELRGAGNLLGAQQHGHLEAIGYDLYIRLLEEAVFDEQTASGLKTEADRPKQQPECAVEIKVDAYLPKSYIKSAPQRMEMYRKIAKIMTADDLSDILDEMCDRFGEPPMAAKNLLKISLIRGLARSCSIVKAEQHDAKELWFIPLAGSVTESVPIWSVLSEQYKNSVKMVMSTPPHISFRIPPQKKPIDAAVEILEKYAKEAAKQDKK